MCRGNVSRIRYEWVDRALFQRLRCAERKTINFRCESAWKDNLSRRLKERLLLHLFCSQSGRSANSLTEVDRRRRIKMQCFKPALISVPQVVSLSSLCDRAFIFYRFSRDRTCVGGTDHVYLPTYSSECTNSRLTFIRWWKRACKLCRIHCRCIYVHIRMCTYVYVNAPVCTLYSSALAATI